MIGKVDLIDETCLVILLKFLEFLMNMNSRKRIGITYNPSSSLFSSFSTCTSVFIFVNVLADPSSEVRVIQIVVNDYKLV